MELDQGLHHVAGLQTAGISAGLKTGASKKDLGLIYFKQAASVAGVFTRNDVKAWPVKYDQQLLTMRDKFQAILVNSGNANACNGPEGQAAIDKIVAELADCLHIDSDAILVSSTGVIGAPFQADQVINNLADLKKHLQDGSSEDFCQAIMTTDTVSKSSALTVDIDGETYHFAGVAKGSGMIHPNMGTMLAYLVTDADLNQAELAEILQGAVDQSFNRVTVDGDTSTNDTVLLASTHEKALAITDDSLMQVAEAVTEVCQSLAQMMASDGEGATKFVTVIVEGAASQEDADKIAGAIAQSSLVKTALFGEDPNFGRVLAAAGYAGADQLDPARIDIYFESDQGQVKVCQEGQGVDFNQDQAKDILSDHDLIVRVNLNLANHESIMWTSDLSFDYVKINAEYTT